MRVAASLIAALMLVAVLLFALRSGEQAGDGPAPASVDSPVASGPPGDIGEVDPGAAESDEPSGAVVVDDGIVNSLPDAGLQSVTTLETEEPPRTVAGLPAIERSVELPVVDPASLDYDPSVGHVTETIEVPESPPDSGFSPGQQLSVNNDGPLAGAQAQPDPTVAGPAGISGVALGTLTPEERALDDPLGPGRPVDPSDAAAQDPMYTLPEDGDIEDPDGTRG